MKNAERRMKNEEWPAVVAIPFLNSAFCVLRSKFIRRYPRIPSIATTIATNAPAEMNSVRFRR